jgi:hypothetical protein
MSTTANLDVSYIASNQNAKEVTANAAFDAFDGALGSLLAHTMTDADYILNLSASPNEALGYLGYVFTGTLTADRNVIVPSNKKLYAVWNNATTDKNLVVKTASGTGIPIAYSATAAYALLYCDGTNVDAVGASGGGSITLSGDTDVSISAPSNGEVLTYNSGSSKWENAAPGGGSSAYVAQHTWVAASSPVGYPSTAYLFGLGFNPVETGSMGTPSYYTALRTPAADTEPLSWKFATSATGSSWHHLEENTAGGGYGGVMGGNLGAFQTVAALEQTTNCRLWIGLSQQPGLAWADNGASYIYTAFRYSTNAGDTNFQCVTQSGVGTNQTVADSGIAADTAFHTFAIRYAVSSWTFYIDGTLVGSINTNCPASNTRMGCIAHIDNLALTNNVAMDLAYMMWTGAI